VVSRQTDPIRVIGLALMQYFRLSRPRFPERRVPAAPN
jgi:hypothetical protein